MRLTSVIVDNSLRSDFTKFNFTYDDLKIIEEGKHKVIKPQKHLSPYVYRGKDTESKSELSIVYYFIKDGKCLAAATFNTIVLLLKDFKFRGILHEKEIKKSQEAPKGIMLELYTLLLKRYVIMSSDSLSMPAFKVWLQLLKEHNGMVIKLDEKQDMSSDRRILTADIENYTLVSEDILKHLGYGDNAPSKYSDTLFLISRTLIVK